MYEHACIKCDGKYRDEDPDPYYCPPCNEVRKSIAKEIDAKIHPSSPIKGGWALFEESQGIQHENGMKFIHEKSL